MVEGVRKSVFEQNRKFGCSFDRAALLGNATDWVKSSGYLLNESNFSGIEMIGWAWNDTHLNSLNLLGIEVVGMHGKAGGKGRDLIDAVKLFGINLIIVDVNGLLKVGQDHNLDYILLHQPVLEEKGVRDMIVKSQSDIRCMMIENHLHNSALKAAVEEVTHLRDLGVNAGLTIDIAHYLNTEIDGHINNPKLIWKDTIKKTHEAARKLRESNPQIPIMLHLAMGETDCIPYQYRTVNKFRMIADLIDTYPDIFVMFEGQQKFIESFKLTTRMAHQQKERNKKAFELSVESGIVLSESKNKIT